MLGSINDYTQTERLYQGISTKNNLPQRPMIWLAFAVEETVVFVRPLARPTPTPRGRGCPLFIQCFPQLTNRGAVQIEKSLVAAA